MDRIQKRDNWCDQKLGRRTRRSSFDHKETLRVEGPSSVFRRVVSSPRARFVRVVNTTPDVLRLDDGTAESEHLDHDAFDSSEDEYDRLHPLIRTSINSRERSIPSTTQQITSRQHTNNDYSKEECVLPHEPSPDTPIMSGHARFLSSSARIFMSRPARLTMSSSTHSRFCAKSNPQDGNTPPIGRMRERLPAIDILPLWSEKHE